MKAVLHLVDLDICEACGALQVYAGCEGGFKTVLHAMHQLFHDLGSQAFLLVDALDALNSVNRQAALHNILRNCPSLAQILINTYQGPVCLIIPGSGGLMSTKGTTQGILWPWPCMLWLLLHLSIISVPVILLFYRYGMLMMLLVLVNVLLFGNGGIHSHSLDPCMATFLMLPKFTL